MVPSLLPKRKSSAPDLDLDSKKSKLGENFDPVVLENISASMIGQEQNNGIFSLLIKYKIIIDFKKYIVRKRR